MGVSQQSSDADLVLGMARGDADALGSLYDRYAQLMFAAAVRILQSPQKAEDLVHDVLMEAWRKAEHYSATRGTVRTWLLVRLRSRALDRLRSANRVRIETLPERPHEELAAHYGGSGTTSSPDRGAEQSRVRDAVAALPVNQRAVLELAYFGGLSSSEIAKHLGIPIGTVKSRTAAGLSKLRSVMCERPIPNSAGSARRMNS